MQKTFRLLMIIIALMALCGQSNAQSNFNDSWVLFDQVSISGPLYSNALPRMATIDATGDYAHFQELTAGYSGRDTTVMDTCLFNEKYSLQYRPERYKEVIANWTNDHNAFTIQTMIYPSPDKTQLIFRIKEEYQLHGEQLWLTVHFENLVNNIHFECKGIYERREK
jgi:hypothetical protein